MIRRQPRSTLFPYTTLFLSTTQARRPPPIRGSIGPEDHWFTTQRKQVNLDQLYWDRLAGKTPRQKHTTASTVNGHYSLVVELRLRATTRVDHPGYAASPQIGVQRPLYSDSGRQCGVPAPVGGQYPLKPLGDTSPAQPYHLSRKAYSTKCTQSNHAGRCTVASQILFNVPVEPERALNPPQLSKRTTRLRDRYLGQDPRRSRTARGVTACTRKSVTHPLLNNAPLREPARLVGPPSTCQWPARLYARAPLQLRAHRARRLTGVPPSLRSAL